MRGPIVRARADRRAPEVSTRTSARSGRDRRAKEAARSRAPESRPEVARPPKVTLRRPEDPGAPRCARSRGGPPPPQTDGPPPSRSAPSAPRRRRGPFTITSVISGVLEQELDRTHPDDRIRNRVHHVRERRSAAACVPARAGETAPPPVPAAGARPAASRPAAGHPPGDQPLVHGPPNVLERIHPIHDASSTCRASLSSARPIRRASARDRP